MRKEIQQLIDSNAELNLAIVQAVFASSPAVNVSIKEVEWPTQIEIVATYGSRELSSCYDKFLEGNDEASDAAWTLSRTNAFLGHLIDLGRAEVGL